MASVTDAIKNSSPTSTVVLVTGSNGLVGQGFKAAISTLPTDTKNKYIFFFASRDSANLEDASECQALFERVKPSIVVHLAAFVGGLFANMSYPVKFFEKNMIMQINIMRSSAKIGTVKRVVSCLSTCIYPSNTTYPIREEFLHQGEPHDSNFAYAYSKRMIEVLGRAYEKQYNIECVSICPTNVYGPHDNFSLANGHVIPSLIHKCYNAVKDNKDFEVLGTGKPLRQFIFNNDLGKIIFKIISKPKLDHKIYILSTPAASEISIKEVAELILEGFVNFDQPFQTRTKKSLTSICWDTSKSDGQYKKTVSVKRLLDEFGDIGFTNIRQGIFQTVSWFANNYSHARK